MKMHLLKPLLVLAAIVMTTYSASAQFTIGPMLAYDSKADLGFGVKAKLPLIDRLQISPSITFFSSEVASLKSTAGEINGDAQYYFNPSGETQFYGVVGLNLLLSKISGMGIDSGLTSHIGVNLGAGAEIDITDSLQGFGQARYTLRKSDRLGLQIGIFFSFSGE